MVLYVAGGVLAVLTWPQVDLLTSEESGDWLAALLGALIASAGSFMVLVSLIGFGVKYGREAANV